MGVFRIFFLENCVLEFPNFLQEAYPLQSKNYCGFGFSGKFEKWPFLAKFGLSLANLAECWNRWKSRKNLKVGDF